MATSYKTPGVYVEEISTLPPSIAPVETAIPAFIGYTEKAVDDDGSSLTNVPKRISSLVEYAEYFGGPQSETKLAVTLSTGSDGVVSGQASLSEANRSNYILYYAMQMFFANGGGPCWIVSVGGYSEIPDESTPPLPDLTELLAGLTAVAKEDEPTLLVIPEAQALSADSYGALMTASIAQCASLQDRFAIMDLHPGDALDLNDSSTNLTTMQTNFRAITLAGELKYGAVYAPNIETTLSFAYEESEVGITGGTQDNLETLGGSSGSTSEYQAALTAIGALKLRLPPSGAVAGIYAAVDSARGVWKAPANKVIANAIQPTVKISSEDQATMNVDPTSGKSINAIRSFTGKGTMVWGARTLEGNSNEWRYVNVRRFFNFVEESTKKATEPFTFEPNDLNTWVKIQAMIENFLTTLWRQGALQGIKPEHAFYVSVGLGKTMSAQDILEGRLIVEIGLAAVRPAEFIILRFSHKMAES